jgi:hypothetical protein
VVKIFLDPRIFNFIIMALYACAATRWAIAGKWFDALYWASAFALIIAVTFR